MQLTNTKNFTFDDANNYDKDNNVDERKVTQSQSLGNKKTISGKYYRLNAHKDNLYKVRR